jgi:L-ribulose-5-phosphate 3-epimerase/hexulose-6-phosphate isomerase
MKTFKKRPIGIYEKALPSKMDWETRLKAVKHAGFNFLEISIDESDERLSRLDWSQEKLDYIKAILKENKIRIPSMCLSGHRRFPFGSKNKDIREKAREIMYKAIEFADYLGIRVIQLAGYDVYYEESDAETRKLFLEGLEEAVQLASRAQIVLAIEIMDTELIGTIKRALKYVDHFNSPWLKIYPDLGNLSQWSKNPAKELEKGIEHIVAVHVKDTKPGVFKGVPFGEGTVNFVELFSKLNALNYNGSFLIEMWADNSKNLSFNESVEKIKRNKIWVEDKMKKAGIYNAEEVKNRSSRSKSRVI